MSCKWKVLYDRLSACFFQFFFLLFYFAKEVLLTAVLISDDERNKGEGKAIDRSEAIYHRNDTFLTD